MAAYYNANFLLWKEFLHVSVHFCGGLWTSQKDHAKLPFKWTRWLLINWLCVHIEHASLDEAFIAT